eukprot:164012-Prorocentrum_minimum.AAC.1
MEEGDCLVFAGNNWKIVSTYEPKIMLTHSPTALKVQNHPSNLHLHLNYHPAATDCTPMTAH